MLCYLLGSILDWFYLRGSIFINLLSPASPLVSAWTRLKPQALRIRLVQFTLDILLILGWSKTSIFFYFILFPRKIQLFPSPDQVNGKSTTTATGKLDVHFVPAQCSFALWVLSSLLLIHSIIFSSHCPILSKVHVDFVYRIFIMLLSRNLSRMMNSIDKYNKGMWLIKWH